MKRCFNCDYSVVSGTENDREEGDKKPDRDTHSRFRSGFSNISNRRQAAAFPAQLRENELLK